MFRTEIHPQQSSHKITFQTPLLTIGSCFADTIGAKFEQNKIPALCNPFGVIYNPVSIFKLIQLAISETTPSPDSYRQRDEVYFNYFFHSSLSDLDSAALGNRIDDRIKEVHNFLANCKWLILSLGTAWVYQRVDNGEIVANCHKEPAQNFSKLLLSRKKILDDLDSLFQNLLEFNPGIRIILTVSPVRHIRDSLQSNQVSKSTLRLVCHSADQDYDRVQYFPSYELVLDDLRDYRFYGPDMIHPSEEAVEYIWQKFTDAYFDDELLAFLKVWKSIHNSLEHRAFHQASSRHQQFLRKTLKQLESLQYPIDVTGEINQIKKQLS